LESVRQFYRDAPSTPLRALPASAAALGLGGLLAKDETNRFGMPAFKISGVRYAVARALDARASSTSSTLAAASTGNHGRAVARTASERGLRARIYLPAGTLPWRVEAIRSESAEVVVTDRGYDDTVRLMAAEAASNGWTVISDASWEGYDEVPRWIMAGYSILMEEASRAWGDRPPDVVVVQAGVGSLAGGIAAWLARTFGRDRPRLLIAEPVGSACVQASLRAGRRVALPSCGPTTMAGLQCAEVSPLAWPMIHATADAAVSVTEAQNEAAMHRLATGPGGEPPIAAGPSGACGFAAITRVMTEPALAPVRDALGLDADARVMAFVTEGV
jgi:diaminopropionate ammonia-lyase